VQLGTGAVQGVCRPGKSLRVANLRGILKDCCCRCAQSQRLQHLDVVEGLPQGVREKILIKAQEG
jgi:hypothetical protein